MRIATWNVERLRHQQALPEIIAFCNRAEADILILTETDEQVKPIYPYGYHTPKLIEVMPKFYKPTENRVSIYTRYPCVCQYPTYDKYTSLCVELETEKGNLIVYGTIIGIYGNRSKNFKEDLPLQISDFISLAARGKSLCVAGDFNLSFSDNYYFTAEGRRSILSCFEEMGISILTEKQPQCIDHIALSDQFASKDQVVIEEWNFDKTLSDHKGVVVDF